MAVISVITGILASVTIPSMVGLMAKNSLESSMSQVKGAIQEAQRAAMKNGRSCWVSIGTSSISTDNTRTNPTQTANATTNPPNICITSPVTLNSDTPLSAKSVSGSTVTDLTLPQSLIFSYKGNPNNTNELVLILSSTKTSTQRCLVISAGIGIMRSGTYSGTTCTSSF
jgi:type II secretory pathway pseudopilin PulG